MPYSDPEKQKAVQRAATRRRRAASRFSAPLRTPGPLPDPVSPVTPAVTAHDLATAARVLGHAQGYDESDEQYRARMRYVWQTVLRVLDP